MGKGRLSFAGYASFLRAVQIEPKAAVELGRQFNVGDNSARVVLRRMHAMRLVHIVGWKQVSARSIESAIYAYGPGEDQPMPLNRINGEPSKRAPAKSGSRLGTELCAFASILRSLSEPTSVKEIAEEAGGSYCNVAKLMKHCKRIGLVRIGAWKQREDGWGGSPAALYVLGSERDAPRPKPIPRAEVHRAYHQRRRDKLKTLRINNALAANTAAFTQAA